MKFQGNVIINNSFYLNRRLIIVNLIILHLKFEILADFRVIESIEKIKKGYAGK